MEESPKWVRWLAILVFGGLVGYTYVYQGFAAMITFSYHGNPIPEMSATPLSLKGWPAFRMGAMCAVGGIAFIVGMVLLERWLNEEDY